MVPESLTCPYCNAPVPVPASGGQAGRLHCPRCGEPFPQRIRAEPTQANGYVPLPLEPPSPVPRSTTTGWSNRAVVRVLLGLMALMALIGLSFALWTKDFRNKISQRRVIVHLQKNAGNDAGVWNPVAPAALRALGYLPTDSNVVGAIHVAEILQDPVGRKFLEPPRPALLQTALARVEEWTGLKPEALDHLVFGTKIGTNLPQVCLVVQTRQPYRLADLARAQVVHGASPGTYRNKPLYHLRIHPVGDLLLWCVDERTLVVLYRFESTRAEDLNAIPDTPRRGADGLPAPLRTYLEKRLARGTLLWVAGHLDQPDVLGPALTLGQVPPEVQQLVMTIQTFGIGLRFQQGVTLLADCHCTDGAAAEHLSNYLKRQTAQLGSFKVVSSPSGPGGPGAWGGGAILGGAPLGLRPWSTAATLVAGMAVGSQPEGEGNWVTLQVRAEPETIRETLNRLSGFLPPVSRP
jgi:hypothetical protein